ncbi:MAG: hypothetical protein JWR44_3527 [Hymenobacter sp.]|nr:hypothetical protein [Hymenobacter sp.]
MKYLSATMPGRLVRLTSQALWLVGLLLGGGLMAPAAQAQAPIWQSVQAMDGRRFITSSITGPGGFVFMVGTFTGTANFGATQLTSANISNDIFVAKWSPTTRTFVWAQRAGGVLSDEAVGVAVQGANVYVTGGFASPTADFGPVTLTNANTSTVGGTSDAFLTKLVDAGSTSSFAWTQRFGGGNIEFGNAVDAVGNSVYVCGTFRSPSIAFGSTTLVNAGVDNAFVAKLTDAGATSSFVWAQQAGGTSIDGAETLAVSGGSVYVGGHFYSPTATFGALTLVNAAANSSEGFVAKLTDAGTSAAFTWALPITGNADEQVIALKASGSNVYLTGAFTSPTATLGGHTLTYAGTGGSISANSFVAKASDTGPTGSFVWAQQPSGSAGFLALALNGQSIYAAGLFSGVVRFGTTTLSTSQGSSDICVAKLTDAGATGSFVWVQQAGGGADDKGYSLSLSGMSICLGGLVGGPGPSTFGSLSLNNPSGPPMGFVATLTDPTLTATTGPRAALAFDLYPNPAPGNAIVQLPPVPGATQATIELKDALGRTVRTEVINLPAAGLRHPLAGLPAGVYAITVEAGNYTATRRLVIE